jgi:hypothetical protein
MCSRRCVSEAALSLPSMEGGGARASLRGSLSLPLLHRFAILVAITRLLLSMAKVGRFGCRTGISW